MTKVLIQAFLLMGGAVWGVVRITMSISYQKHRPPKLGLQEGKWTDRPSPRSSRSSVFWSVCWNVLLFLAWIPLSYFLAFFLDPLLAPILEAVLPSP